MPVFLLAAVGVGGFLWFQSQNASNKARLTGQQTGPLGSLLSGAETAISNLAQGSAGNNLSNALGGVSQKVLNVGGSSAAGPDQGTVGSTTNGFNTGTPTGGSTATNGQGGDDNSDPTEDDTSDDATTDGDGGGPIPFF